MKKITLVFILIMLLIAAGGCGVPDGQPADDRRLKVVTTIFPPYDFVREIAGDQVDLTMLIAPGAEIHYYEPTPEDIIALSQCDVFICVGGESDAWVDDVLASVDTSAITVLRLIEICDGLVEEEIVEGMEVHEHSHEHGSEAHDHDDEHYADDHDADEHGDELDEAEYDEHVWTSPRLTMQIINGLCDALCAAAPQQADSFRAAAAVYQQELAELDADFREVTDNAQRRLIVFGDRFPFRYFAEEYGLDYYAAFPGCAEQTEPSAATMAFLIDKVREENISVVFRNELSSGNEAAVIAESTGAQVLTFYACHNISRDDMEAGVSYLSLMRQNVESLRQALN